MTLQASGTIKMSDVNVEAGDPANTPITMTQCFSKLSSYPNSNGVNPLKMSELYSASATQYLADYDFQDLTLWGTRNSPVTGSVESSTVNETDSTGIVIDGDLNLSFTCTINSLDVGQLGGQDLILTLQVGEDTGANISSLLNTSDSGNTANDVLSVSGTVIEANLLSQVYVTVKLETSF